ncbi:hypothetical protein QAD02_011119 [Eretmocerus hayati]|uniref:Uncharacterized protein n=1 Tax=Eretmocerus hayati TaxID=131215 RepID=A0ACC2NWU8_9HYME|nr:hypothetical protein QAD02_011119 [Eretmocerus hayati]
MKLWICVIVLSAFVALGICENITISVFGPQVRNIPMAFGDFNSDELTDVFVRTGNDRTVQIMLANLEEPILQKSDKHKCDFKNQVTSIVPGDFDGDVFMDILVTTIVIDVPKPYTEVFILWGGDTSLNCTNASTPILKIKDQPLAMDYNQDMIIDLFGADENGTRFFWIFNTDRSAPEKIKMEEPVGQLSPMESIRIPHSNGFLDLDGDHYSDLFITTDKYFEVWNGKKGGFEFGHTIPLPPQDVDYYIGQSIHADVELLGKMDLIVPTCILVNSACTKSKIMVYSDNKWQDLGVDFTDSSKTQWEFAKEEQPYLNTVTMHGGDFNMDGYPDLLVTLKSSSTQQTRALLLENVSCNNCGNVNRTFKIKWDALEPFNNMESIAAVFYDFFQNGILDVILVLRDKSKVDKHEMAAFKNSDYDANFIKVMVLTGRVNDKFPVSQGPISLSRTKKTYGTNLPGPSITYNTYTQDGLPRTAMGAQLPQSAHLSMNLPFTIFGLGRTPNFIEMVTIGLNGLKKECPQIIPNSQMVVIPKPMDDPSRWKAQLFVTPSKIILLSAAALLATCGLITLIIVALYWKERREDKFEKLQEAHRFHFDAM